jgi:hypothetical protein
VSPVPIPTNSAPARSDNIWRMAPSAIVLPRVPTSARSRSAFSTPLQRQHQRIRRKMRLDGSCTAFGVGGLHAKEHELRALHRARFSAGRDANAFVEGLCFEPEPLTLDCLDVLGVPN